MSKRKSAEKKELELRQQKAETEKAELELVTARLQAQISQREYDYAYTTSSDTTGVFHFSGVVSDTAARSFSGSVRRYAQLNPESPITVILNTPGGSVVAGFGLFDDLRSLSDLGHHITTKVRGYAASMGAVLLQAGDTRHVGPESLVMVHEITSGSMGKVHEMENDLETSKKLNSRVFDILARHTDGKWTGPRLYSKVKAKDWWLSAEETVKEGLADEIG